jgi:hypothetical protein
VRNAELPSEEGSVNPGIRVSSSIPVSKNEQAELEGRKETEDGGSNNREGTADLKSSVAFEGGGRGAL